MKDFTRVIGILIRCKCDNIIEMALEGVVVTTDY